MSSEEKYPLISNSINPLLLYKFSQYKSQWVSRYWRRE